MPLWNWSKEKWERVPLNGTYQAFDAFVCCPGPSLADVDGTDLQIGGAITIAVNTAYPKIRPGFWIGMDKVECYDPALVTEPFPKLFRGNYHRMTFQGRPVRDYTNAYFADIRAGSLEGIFTQTGTETRFVWQNNTFLVALHFAVWIGCKRIWLVGCDFGGDKDYYDDRVLTDSQRDGNKRLYAKIVDQFPELKRLGEEHGVEFRSCTPGSPVNEHLEYTPLKEALGMIRAGQPTSVSGPLNCRDVAMCEWKDAQEPFGIVTGCDAEQEWMLDFWWENYSKHNEYPVAFADFGMSDDARAWCAARGTVIDVNDVDVPVVWHKKPFALLRSRFEQVVWIDVDCEVRADVGELRNMKRLSVTEDSGYPEDERAYAGQLIYASGVVCASHGDPLVEEWARLTIKRADDFRGDQETLNYVIRRWNGTGAVVSLLPKVWQSVRMDPEQVENPKIYHWTGSDGKDELRQTMRRTGTGRWSDTSPGVPVNNRSGVTAGEAQLLIKYASRVSQPIIEIGTWKGGTTEILAHANRNQVIWTVDAYVPYREFSGKHPSTPDELYREHFEKYGRVFPVVGKSQEVGKFWKDEIGFLFIDGLHEYNAVKTDFEVWSPLTAKYIAFHDAVAQKPVKRALNGNPLTGSAGAIRFVEEMADNPKWKEVERVDSLVVFERITPRR